MKRIWCITWMALLVFAGLAEEPMARFGVLADPQYADAEPLIGRNYRVGKELVFRTIELFNQEKRLDFICSLGDIVDGRTQQDLQEVLEVFKKSNVQVRHALGNHDLLLQSDDDLKNAFGIRAFNDSFKVGGVRFVILHSMEISLMRPAESKERKAAEDYVKANPDRRLEHFNGMLSGSTKLWFQNILSKADENGETVVVLTHIPICTEASHASTVLWDADDMLAMIDTHPCVKGWIAGHHHSGGMAERNGVLHKTVKGLCEMPEATGCIVSVFQNRIEIKGVGQEQDFVFYFSPHRR